MSPRSAGCGGLVLHHPLPAFEAVRTHLSFYPGRIECHVDGVRVTPQAGGFYGGWVTPELRRSLQGRPWHEWMVRASNPTASSRGQGQQGGSPRQRHLGPPGAPTLVPRSGAARMQPSRRGPPTAIVAVAEEDASWREAVHHRLYGHGPIDLWPQLERLALDDGSYGPGQQVDQSGRRRRTPADRSHPLISRPQGLPGNRRAARRRGPPAPPGWDVQRGDLEPSPSQRARLLRDSVPDSEHTPQCVGAMASTSSPSSTNRWTIPPSACNT